MAVKTMILGVALAMVSAPAAHALSEWWTPDGKSCPTFDTEESCETWCASNQEPCGGATQCTFQTGPKRPECSLPVAK